MDNRKDQMIYFKDMLFSVLRRWRVVLLVAAVLALILGGVQGIKSWNAVNQNILDDEAYTAALEQYDADKSVLDAKVAALEHSLQNQKNYVEKAPLMQLDPNAFYSASITLHAADAQETVPGKTGAVLAAYQAAFTGERAVAVLAQAMDISTDYAVELVCCTVDLDLSTCNVVVLCADSDMAAAARNALVQLAVDLQAEINKSMASHTMTVLDKSVNLTREQKLAEQQKQALEDLTAMETSVTEARNASAALPMPVMSSYGKAHVVKSAVVFAVIGAVLGCAVSVLTIWVAHIASAKVYSVRTLHDRTGVKVFGGLQTNGLKNPIDRWIWNLEGRNIAPTNLQAALMAANIRSRAGETKKILVTGTMENDGICVMAAALQAAMPEAVVTAGATLGSAAAFEALEKHDAVVLVEACDISNYTQIGTAIELIEDCKKTLMGCVLVGG